MDTSRKAINTHMFTNSVKQFSMHLQNNLQNARHCAVSIYEIRLDKWDLEFLVYLIFWKYFSFFHTQLRFPDLTVISDYLSVMFF